MIKLFATFEDARCFYLVMECLSGGELLKRIMNDGAFDEQRAAIVMKQIFRALHYLHDRIFVAHRDLKLDNFLFTNEEDIADPSNHLKLIDFGEAKALTGEPLTTRIGTPFYVAPDVLNACYTEKADMWSCGVICYMILCGYPPFPGADNKEITQGIMKGDYEFHDDHWSEISNDAKDMVRKLLSYNPDMRICSEEALQHRWILLGAPRATIRKGGTQAKLLGNLQSFNSQNKLQQMAINAVARTLDEKEIESLKQLFLALDANGDGQLTVEELKTGLEESGREDLGGSLEKIMQECDADGNGVLDYTEFLAATADKRRVLQEDVCWQAFRVFDIDGSGKIDKEELKSILDNQQVQEILTMDAESIMEILAKTDENGDGEIDFDEFMAMMRQ